jgi:signal transduction histidine kinase/pSer/pThr/pTyr-binding forkhead associated (FHA) protein/ActR/RegA family two-component response regulator
MKRHLLEQTDGVLSTIFFLSEETTLGRSLRSNIHLTNPDVSRRHARLIRREREWVLVDLDSRNGTFVNGRKIRQCGVHHGDRIRLSTVELRFLSFETKEDERSLLETEEAAPWRPETIQMHQEVPEKDKDNPQSLLKLLLNGLPVPLAVLDKDGRAIFYNQAFDSCGVSEPEGHFDFVRFHLCGAPRSGPQACRCLLCAALDRALGEGLPVIDQEMTWLEGKETPSIHLRFSLFPLPRRLTGKAFAVFVLTDATPHKELDEELLTTQKLESIAVLTHGIAHDFNNILTSVLGNLSLLRYLKADPDKVEELLGEAEKAALRAKDLTRQLLTFSGGGVPVKTALHVPKFLRESAEFALREFNCSCEFQIEENLWTVHADVGLMNQVIHNLVLNAAEAMPEGGTIRIRAENLNVRSKEDAPLRPRGYVKISIKDDGVGISQENLARVFDPYFTTKGDSRGMGLAIAFAIVRRHDGSIMAESQAGMGSTFHIYLPASRKQVVEFRDRDDGLLVGKGKVLLMDDEEMVRKVAGQMLEHLGYQVVMAGDGSEAIEQFRQAHAAGQKFEAIILDLTVPGGLGGLETFGHLRSLDPDVRALVSSGYANDPVMSDYRRYGFAGIIRKPYEIEELGRTLHYIIGRKAGNLHKSFAKPQG